MDRRTLLASSFASLWVVAPLGASGQERRRARIGWLTGTRNPQLDSFRAGMRDLGYVEGRDWVLEDRDAGGDLDKIDGLVAELSALPVDVLVAVGTAAARPAHERIKNIPIVTMTNDFVGRGFGRSLAQPGGNVTGIEMMALEMNVKWLELLAELLPQATRFFGLAHPTTGRERMRPIVEASRSQGRSLDIIEVGDRDGLRPAFERLAAAGAEGLIVLASAIFHGLRQDIVDLAAHFRIPAIYEHRDFAAAGGLMSYGPDVEALFARIAYFVDRILKGAPPGGLPVEQPTKVDFVVNLKAAKALGLTVPPLLLLRADELIE